MKLKSNETNLELVYHERSILPVGYEHAEPFYYFTVWIFITYALNMFIFSIAIEIVASPRVIDVYINNDIQTITRLR